MTQTNVKSPLIFCLFIIQSHCLYFSNGITTQLWLLLHCLPPTPTPLSSAVTVCFEWAAKAAGWQERKRSAYLFTGFTRALQIILVLFHWHSKALRSPCSLFSMLDKTATCTRWLEINRLWVSFHISCLTLHCRYSQWVWPQRSKKRRKFQSLVQNKV